MNINWNLVVEAVKALAWPVFSAFALYLLRRPIVELVGQIARRARKVSIFEVSVELATLPELQPSWAVGNADPRRLSSSMIFDSASVSLFQQLLYPVQAEYAIVDLRSGQAWLTSRLFIFAVILGEVTGLRAFVFLENVQGVWRRYLGVASPANVRKALGRKYPSLEEAFARALSNYYPNVPLPATGIKPFSNLSAPLSRENQNGISGIVKSFIEELQRTIEPPDNEKKFYLKLETDPVAWERTRWIDGERLERDLSGVLEYAWVEDAPDNISNPISEAVCRRNAAFVALVDKDRKFSALVDRTALLAEIAVANNKSRNAGQ